MGVVSDTCRKEILKWAYVFLAPLGIVLILLIPSFINRDWTTIYVCLVPLYIMPVVIMTSMVFLVVGIGMMLQKISRGVKLWA
jgi:uncharacterized membrane protein